MLISIFQSACGGLDVSGKLENLRYALDTTECDLLICPELFLSGYNIGVDLVTFAKKESPKALKNAATFAREYNTGLVVGYPEYAEGQLYNSVCVLDNTGKIIANHRKLLIPPGFETQYFTAGDQHTIFNYHGIRCAVLICYDVEFPETVRSLAQQGAQLVIVPTALNENWSVVAEKVIPSRAFENGIYLAYANHSGSENGVNYLGKSCIIHPNGQDIVRAGSDEQIISAVIDIKQVSDAQNRLPYLKDVQTINAKT